MSTSTSTQGPSQGTTSPKTKKRSRSRSRSSIPDAKKSKIIHPVVTLEDKRELRDAKSRDLLCYLLTDWNVLLQAQVSLLTKPFDSFKSNPAMWSNAESLCTTLKAMCPSSTDDFAIVDDFTSLSLLMGDTATDVLQWLEENPTEHVPSAQQSLLVCQKMHQIMSDLASLGGSQVVDETADAKKTRSTMTQVLDQVRFNLEHRVRPIVWPFQVWADNKEAVLNAKELYALLTLGEKPWTDFSSFLDLAYALEAAANSFLAYAKHGTLTQIEMETMTTKAKKLMRDLVSLHGGPMSAIAKDLHTPEKSHEEFIKMLKMLSANEQPTPKPTYEEFCANKEENENAELLCIMLNSLSPSPRHEDWEVVDSFESLLGDLQESAKSYLEIDPPPRPSQDTMESILDRFFRLRAFLERDSSLL